MPQKIVTVQTLIDALDQTVLDREAMVVSQDIGVANRVYWGYAVIVKENGQKIVFNESEHEDDSQEFMDHLKDDYPDWEVSVERVLFVEAEIQWPGLEDDEEYEL
jgi:uncharacterized protein YaiI (UPF0178 family)